MVSSLVQEMSGFCEFGVMGRSREIERDRGGYTVRVGTASARDGDFHHKLGLRLWGHKIGTRGRSWFKFGNDSIDET